MTDDLAAAGIGKLLLSAHPDRGDLTVTAIAPITGGYSCRMYRVDIAWGSGRSETLVVRADPQPGQAMIQVTRDHEYDVLAALGSTSLPVPGVRWCDVDATHLGVQATVMEFLDGIPLNQLIAEQGASTELLDALADLSGDIANVPLEVLPPRLTRPADGASWLDQIVTLWRELEKNHPESLPFFRYCTAWLDKNRPAPARLSLLHGDFSNANLMMVDGVLHAVDWDLAEIGDPRADLGYYKLYAGMVPPDLTSLDIERFCARYRDRTGMTEEVVNPAALAYFAVLGNALQLRVFLPGVAAYCAGYTSNLQLPFNMANAVAMLQGSWVDGLTQLEKSLEAASTL